MKGRTEEELPDPAKDMAGAPASRPSSHEGLGGGKHEGVQEPSFNSHAHTMDCSSLRVAGPGLVGTARCGPARRVVWEPWLINLGDPIRRSERPSFTPRHVLDSTFCFHLLHGLDRFWHVLLGNLEDLLRLSAGFKS